MGWFTFVFLLVLAFNLALKFWLDARQRRAMLAHADAVPAAFAARVTPEEHSKAAKYGVAALRDAGLDRLAGTVLLLAWTLGGGIELLDHAWRGVFRHPLLLGVCVVLSLHLVEWAFWIPFKYRHTFGLEQRFGFNRSTRKTFVLDQLRVLLLTIVLVTSLTAAALWLMKATGPLWWLWLWGMWVATVLLIMWIYPRWLAPLFNKLQPLPDGPLKTRVLGLLQRCGFESSGVFVMDGSKRSSRGNAYFGGMGRNKRIVFFDTLLKQLDESELEAVLAHELGHFRLKHTVKSLVITSVFVLGCAALLGWIHGQPWFYTQLGVKRPSDYAALLLFMQVSPSFFTLLRPLKAWLSRAHEFQADAFAVANADGRKLADGLVKITRENANTLTPDPLYSSFYYSHPPLVERLSALEAAMPATYRPVTG